MVLSRKLCLLFLFAFLVGYARGQTPQGPTNISSTSTANCPAISVGQNATVGIHVEGTWSATLQPQIGLAGRSPSNTTVYPYGSTTSQGTITANGDYFAPVSAASTFILCASAYTSGTATVYLTISQASAKTGGGGGGGTNNPGGTAGQIQTNGGSVFDAFTASGDATINTTTGVVTNIGINGGSIPTSATLVGTNSSKQIVAVTTPLSVANGGSGTATPGLVAGSNVTITGSWPNQTVAASGGSGFPSGVGIAGAVVSGTPVTSAEFLPPVDVRLFFTTPYPTYTQAQSQDFGAVLNAALVAATPTGACVDVSGLNNLNAPNIAVYPVTTNIFANLASNTYVPCIIGANFQIVTSVTQATAGGSLKISGNAPGGIGGTGLVVQPCNTTGNCTVGGTTVTKFPTSASCASSGGIDCYATGVPSSGTLSTYTTGTVTYTTGSKTVTGSGTTWTSAMVGGTFVSACGSASLAACTVGSTSLYTTGRIVAVGSSTSLTLDAVYAGNVASATAGQHYVIFLPNTSVVWCDACQGNNLQKSFTGHEIDDLAIDLNGISGVGYLAKGAQEGSVLNNFACFLSFGTPTGLTAGGTCLAWDQSVRESGATGGTTANQTFLGHFSVHDGRMGVGATGAGGSNAFGAVVEGFSQMDGTVGLSQANGASVWDFQAMIGGSGSNRFQDALYIDGISGMNITGTHFEATLNDDINVGPVNPAYNIGIYNITSSATLGNCAVEFGSGTSGNSVRGVSRPTGGCLVKDDNLATPTVATSSSGTAASWTMPDYLQAGNSGNSLVAGGAITATSTMTINGATSGSASIGAAAVAGSPATIVLPITNPTNGQVLTAAAPVGSTVQTSWTNASGGTSFTGSQFAIQTTDGSGNAVAVNAPSGGGGAITGITYNLTSTVGSGGAAQAFVPTLPGVLSRAVTINSGTGLVSTDCQGTIIAYEGATGAVTDTLPTATTLGLPNCFMTLTVPPGSPASPTAVTKVTITPTTWTINGASTLVITPGQSAYLSPDPNSSTNWLARVPDQLRTWQKEYRALCQMGNVGLPINTNAAVVTVAQPCSSTVITGEWAIPSTNTTATWYSTWTVPSGHIGAYTYNVVFRSSATTGTATMQLQYACVAAGQVPDNPGFTNVGSTITLTPAGTTLQNATASATFTPTCADGSDLYILRTFTANSIAAQLNFSSERFSIQANP